MISSLGRENAQDNKLCTEAHQVASHRYSVNPRWRSIQGDKNHLANSTMKQSSRPHPGRGSHHEHPAAVQRTSTSDAPITLASPRGDGHATNDSPRSSPAQLGIQVLAHGDTAGLARRIAKRGNREAFASNTAADCKHHVRRQRRPRRRWARWLAAGGRAMRAGRGIGREGSAG